MSSIYSSYYYEPDFELGEDIRTEERAKQDDEWKHAVQDGRAHVSHREATTTHASRLAGAIQTHHQVEALVDCMMGANDMKKNYMQRLDQYMGFSIVEFLHGLGHGFLLTAALARRLVDVSTSAGAASGATSFRLCVRKRPLLSFEVLDGSEDARCLTRPMALESDLPAPAPALSRIPYDACCATLAPKQACVCLHDGKLARNGRRLTMQHHFTFADRVWGELEENRAFCEEEVLPLLTFAAPVAGVADRRATLICFGQTGTGKTFTLNACLQYLACVLVGTLAPAGTEAYLGCSVHIKFFEVHGKKCYDLLNDRKEVKLLADGADVMHLRGAQCIVLDSSEGEGGGGAGAARDREQRMMSCLSAALLLRSAQVTERNPVSSRSHAVCELTVHFADPDAAACSGRTGTIRLVDLAGSERNYETFKMSAKDHAESADINSALMALKDCFRASSAQVRGVVGLPASASAECRKTNIRKATSSYEGPSGSSSGGSSSITNVMPTRGPGPAEESKAGERGMWNKKQKQPAASVATAGPVHIPFRAHILTRVLKDCFVAPASESRTTVVATVSPSPVDLVHSLNTLEHAVLMCPKLQPYKTSITVDIPVVGMLRSQEPMEKWSAAQVQSWLATADNGRFSMLQVPRELDGRGLCSLNSSSLSALFEGTLRQARMGGEGNAWVVGVDATDADAAVPSNPPTELYTVTQGVGVDMGFVSMDNSSMGVTSAGGGTSVTNTIHGAIATNTIARALWSAIRREQASIAYKTSKRK